DRQGVNTLTAGTDNLVTSVQFNERGQLTHLNRGNGRHTLYDYNGGDENFSLDTIQHGADADTLPDFICTYDSVGNILTVGERLTNTQTQTFIYDDLNRLVDASAPAVSPRPAYSHEYAYDEMGNMTGYADKSYRYSGDYNDQPHAVRAVYDADTS